MIAILHGVDVSSQEVIEHSSSSVLTIPTSEILHQSNDKT